MDLMRKARDERSRRRGAVPALLAINGLLLLLLGVVTLGSPAGAQTRVRGDYTMVAGSVNGSDSGAVYIVDTVNREMIAITYDPNQGQLEGVGYRNLAADVATIVQGGPQR